MVLRRALRAGYRVRSVLVDAKRLDQVLERAGALGSATRARKTA